MTWFTAIQNVLNTITVALITILVGFIIAKLASRIAKRVMKEAELNRILAKAGLRPFSDTIGSLIEYLLYMATLLIVLQQLGLTTLVLGIIIIIAAIVIGFILLLAVRNFIPNALVGIFVRQRMKRYLGKKVRLGSITGRLEHIGIVASVIKNADEHSIPHLYASKQKIKPLRAS